MPDKDEIAFAISDSEVDVLKCLWLESPLTAQQIVDKLQRDGNSHPQTIKSLINRLLKKAPWDFTRKPGNTFTTRQSPKTIFIKSRQTLSNIKSGQTLSNIKSGQTLSNIKSGQTLS